MNVTDTDVYVERLTAKRTDTQETSDQNETTWSSRHSEHEPAKHLPR